jgi:TonB family protein
MRIVAMGMVVSLWLGAQELAHNTPPRLSKKAEPQYSDEARRAGLEGNVVLRVGVGVDGRTRDIKVVRGIGMGLDEKAVEAVSDWQFHPATKNGEPMEVQAQIDVNFRLLQAKWHLGRAEFHLPDGASRPIVAMAKAPRVADDAAKAMTTVDFDIDENGAPTNFRRNPATDEEWASDVIEALREWTFTPASKEGHAAPVSCTMDFFRGN